MQTVADGPHASIYSLTSTTCAGNGGALMYNTCYCPVASWLNADRFSPTTPVNEKLGLLAIGHFLRVNIAELHDLGVVARILDILEALWARAWRLPSDLSDAGDELDGCTRAARDSDRESLGTLWAAFTRMIWAPVSSNRVKFRVSRVELASTARGARDRPVKPYWEGLVSTARADSAGHARSCAAHEALAACVRRARCVCDVGGRTERLRDTDQDLEDFYNIQGLTAYRLTVSPKSVTHNSTVVSEVKRQRLGRQWSRRKTPFRKPRACAARAAIVH